MNDVYQDDVWHALKKRKGICMLSNLVVTNQKKNLFQFHRSTCWRPWLDGWMVGWLDG